MLKKFIAVTTTLLVAAGLSLVGFAAPASATHPVVTGTAVCNPSTGLFDLSWTVQGDTGYPSAVAEITEQSRATVPTLVGLTVQNTGTVSAPEAAGVGPGTYTNLVTVEWNNDPNHTAEDEGSVTTSGTCNESPAPAVPSVTEATECEVLDSIVVPADTAKLDYTQTPSPAAVGLNTVTVAPIAPWILPTTVVAGWVETTPNQLWTWTTTLSEPEACPPTLGVIDVNAISTSGVCTPSTGTVSSGFITTSVEGGLATQVSFFRGTTADPKAIAMTVGANNPLPPGTYLVTAYPTDPAADSVVPASPGTGVSNPDGSVSWTLTITAAPANPLCDELETMALTGYERAPEVSGGAAALLVVGIVALFFGYRRFA